MQFETPSKKGGPNLKLCYKRFGLNFMKMEIKSCLVQQMTEKFAVEVDAKNHFWKKCKNIEEYLSNEDV